MKTLHKNLSKLSLFLIVAILFSRSCFVGCTDNNRNSVEPFDFELHKPTDNIGFADGYGYVLCEDDCVMITDGSAAVGDVVIPETIVGKRVVGITASAFRNNSSITSLTLPSSLEYIACYAFAMAGRRWCVH